MTSIEDWQFRAKYLRDMAERRWHQAQQFITEQRELNNLALRCEDEANRLRRSPSCPQCGALPCDQIL